jgi:hypothetical protein
MARRQHQNSVSLFPFLAVLVCAMGSLILLLLVMTRKIRQDQQAIPEPAAASVVSEEASVSRQREIATLSAEVNSLQLTVQSLRERVKQLEQAVVRHRSAVADKQAQLSGLQSEIRATSSNTKGKAAEELDLELKTLREQESRLVAELSETERGLLEKRDQLARVEDAMKDAEIRLFEKSSALVSLREQVRKAEQAAAASTGTETLLQFSNSTGSSRTPIVIDVTSRGFELLPNGVEITMGDMESFPVRDNPLLSAILATHRHRSGRAVTDAPYVLLLVRPGGSLAFYGAQRILTESNIHYGYELILQDRSIVAGEPDPGEPPLVRLAMAEAFRRRENLYAKLFAMTEQERQRQGAAGGGGVGESEPQERKLTIRPDGRVIEETPKAPRRLEGKFYAGGVAPPPSFFENRAESQAAGNPRGRMQAADAERLAEEFAERYAQQRALAEAAVAANRVAEGAEEQNVVTKKGVSDPSLGDDALRGSVLRSETEKRFADAMFGGDGTLQGSRLIGRRSDAFSGSPLKSSAGGSGVPIAGGSGSTALDQLLSESRAGTAASATGQAQSATAGASKPNSPEVPALAASNTQAAGEDGVPWYQSSKSSESGKSRAGGVPGSGQSDNDSTGESASDVSGDRSRVDRDTMRRLGGRGKRSSGEAIPVGIVVFLDEQHMMIAQQSAVKISEQQVEFAEAALLKGMNIELQDARRSPRDELMPIVRFVVSPGGEKWRVPLAASLRRSGIHSVVLYEVTPYMLPRDDAGYAHLAAAATEEAP